MKAEAIFELLLKAIPHPHLIKQIEMEPEAIRFTWRGARYRVEGTDLHSDLPVELRDAVLGAKVAADTPSGKVAVTIPPWSSSDKVLRLKGRGLPHKTSGDGDLYVHVRVMLPENGDADLEALMKKASV